MKFSCERCGKKYATAETPAPGRVYKIKCKACGHLIVVKASAAQQTATSELRPPPATEVLPTPVPAHLPAPADAASPPPLPPAVAAAPGLLDLEVAPPVPAEPSLVDIEITPPELADPGPALEPLPPEPPQAPAEEAQGPGASADVAPGPPAAEVAAPPSEGGYVDLFGDSSKGESGEVPAPYVRDDPFAVAARASLPETYGQGAPAPDPFAPMRDGPGSPGSGASGAGLSRTQSAMKVPVLVKPAQRTSTGPIVLIGAGGLVLVGILAFVLLGGKKAPPPAAQAQAQAQVQAPAPPPVAPAPAPAAQPEPPPVAAPPAAAQAAAPTPAPRSTQRGSSDDDRRARDREAKQAREREKAAREERVRADREARDREKAARDEKARSDREARDRDRQRREAEKVAAASMAEPEGGLTQDAVQRVLSSTRKAFESCIVTGGKAGEVKLDGRRVLLRLNIQSNGAVTYPTLDDVTLNGTELGSCLKSAARLMVFPKFKGDTMHVEVPLVLAGGK